MSDAPTILALNVPSWWWMMHVPAIVFIFCFGACVGSFLNVVIYRLPAGMSVINPPSRCPTCGASLKFFRENLPILGWFMVKGRCRYCGVKISPQYMIVETLMALIFVGMYLLLFAITPGTLFWSGVGGSWWHYNTIVRAWPAFIVWTFLIAGLLAMTVIDARRFIIPLQIPLFITITAFIAWPLQAILPQRGSLSQSWPIPGVSWTGFLMSVGGMLGVAISFALLKAGKLRYSFADYNAYIPAPPEPSSSGATDASRQAEGGVTAFELLFAIPIVAGIVAAPVIGFVAAGVLAIAAMLVIVAVCRAHGMRFGPETEPKAEEVLADYPHARREMLTEIIYLAPCVALMAAGWLIGRGMAGYPSPLVQAIGATFAGYLVGGGLVWAIRILGTLGFGREAMGLGDVHLLAAVGAALGWSDPILVFFIAPFLGLVWALYAIGLTSIFRGARRELPYGPHLALATLVVILWRPWINQGFATYMPNVPYPPPAGLCPTARSKPAIMFPVPRTTPRPGTTRPATTAP